MNVTKEQVAAAINIVKIVSEAVREAESIPEGYVFAALAAHGCTVEAFNKIVGTLVSAGLVKKSGVILSWIGPNLAKPAAAPTLEENWKIVCSYMHYDGENKGKLNNRQWCEVYMLCDGFGKLPTLRYASDVLEFDWSHVRDSSEAAVKAAADRIREWQAAGLVK